METNEQIIDDLKSKYNADVIAKGINLLETELFARFYGGEHYIQYNASTNSIVDAAFYSNRKYIPRTYTNKFREEIDNSVSMMIRNDPLPIGVPISDDYRDKEAAKLGEEILKYLNWASEEAINWEMLGLWRALSGTVYRKDYWDVSTKEITRVPKTETVNKEIVDGLGNPVIDPATGKPKTYETEETVIDANGEVVYDELPLGDIKSAIKTIFEISVDPKAKIKMEEGNWVMETSMVDLGWAKEQYAKKNGDGYTGLVEKLEHYVPEDLATGGLLRLSVFRLGSSSAATIENSCMIKEYYEAPCKKYPKGRMIITGNDAEVLFNGDNLYYDCNFWHPYTDFHWKRTPGRFLSIPLARDLYPLQKRLNGIDSLMSLHRMTAAVPQKAYMKGMGIKKGEMTGAPGQVFEVHPHPLGVNGVITTLPAGSLDQGVMTERQFIVNDMSIFSGSMEANRISRAGRLTAVEVSLTDEYAINKMAPIIRSWERSISRVFEKQLCIIGEKYREPRNGMLQRLKAFSNNRMIKKLEQLSGEELRKNYRVRVEVGSTLAKSRSAEQDLILKTFSTGILGNIADPATAEVIRQRLGLFNIDGIKDPDRELALWENSQMESGVDMPINEYDNHATHLNAAYEFIKAPYFKSLDKAIQDIALAHSKLHAAHLAQASQAQMAAQTQAMLAPEQLKAEAFLKKQEMKDETLLKVTDMKDKAATERTIINHAAGAAVVNAQHMGGLERDEIKRLNTPEDGAGT